MSKRDLKGVTECQEVTRQSGLVRRSRVTCDRLITSGVAESFQQVSSKKNARYNIFFTLQFFTPVYSQVFLTFLIGNGKKMEWQKRL